MKDKNFKPKRADFSDIFGSLKNVKCKGKRMTGQEFKDFVRADGNQSQIKKETKHRKH